MSAPENCTCEACGARASCEPHAPAPPGWFWMPIYASPKDDVELVIILACSEACRALPWRKQPRAERKVSA